MSFFAKIFGGGEKKPEEKPVQKKVDLGLQDKIERERAKNNIEKQLKQFDDKQKKLEAKAEQLKQKAKQLVKADKKNEARKFLGEVQRINKQIEAVLIHKKAVLENVAQLQSADMTAETTKILQETKRHLDQHQKNSQKLLDLIEEANIRKREQQEIHERMKALVDNDSDKQAEDEMLAQIMGEVQRQKRIEQKKIIAQKEVEVKVPEQKHKAVQQRDEIEDMLNAL